MSAPLITRGEPGKLLIDAVLPEASLKLFQPSAILSASAMEIQESLPPPSPAFTLT
jgi:hypothetical protein